MGSTGFVKELEELINRHSMENGSNTPDFILASYLRNCLENFNLCVNSRERWYDKNGKVFENTLLETPLEQK